MIRAPTVHVRADRRAAIRPLVTSHGANDPRTDRPRFRLEWDWTGRCRHFDPNGKLLGAIKPEGRLQLAAGDNAVTLTATDAAGAGQDLTVDTGVTVESRGGGAVRLQAGDNLTVAAGATVTTTGVLTVTTTGAEVICILPTVAITLSEWVPSDGLSQTCV